MPVRGRSSVEIVSIVKWAIDMRLHSCASSLGAGACRPRQSRATNANEMPGAGLQVVFRERQRPALSKVSDPDAQKCARWFSLANCITRDVPAKKKNQVKYAHSGPVAFDRAVPFAKFAFASITL